MSRLVNAEPSAPFRWASQRASCEDVCASCTTSGRGHERTPPVARGRSHGCRRVGAAGADRSGGPRLRLLRRRRPRKGSDSRAPLARRRTRDPRRQWSHVRTRVSRGSSETEPGSDPKTIAVAMAVTEHLVLYPACYFIDRFHPARGQPGIPPLLTSRRAFAQATWRTRAVRNSAWLAGAKEPAAHGRGC